MEFYIYADDLGLRHSTTIAINEAFSKGWIQGTGLITNTENLGEAVQLAKENGYMDRVCFHLNLTSEYPLTEEIRHTALCSESGQFCMRTKSRINMRIQRNCMSVKAIRAIRAECAAQMQLFRDMGFTAKRIDSHQWVLCNLPVWLAIKPLLKQYGFTKTRTLSGHLINQAKGWLKVYYQIMALLIKKELRTEADWSGCTSELQAVVLNTSREDNSIKELYVHPEVINGVLLDTYYTYSRATRKQPLDQVIQIASQFGAPTEQSWN